MAKAELSGTLATAAKGLQEKKSNLKPEKGFGAYFQRSKDSTTIRTKHPLRGCYGRGRPYEKERFCYIDGLYRAMERLWFTLWIDYYRDVRAAKYPMIFPSTERQSHHTIDPKKEIGTYSLFMSLWMKNEVAEFNEQKIGSVFQIINLDIEDNALSIEFIYTNRTEAEQVPVNFFDPNIMRLGGRI